MHQAGGALLVADDEFDLEDLDAAARDDFERAELGRAGARGKAARDREDDEREERQSILPKSAKGLSLTPAVGSAVGPADIMPRPIAIGQVHHFGSIQIQLPGI